MYLLLMVLIGLIYPVYGIASGKKTKKLLLEQPDQKIPVYQFSMSVLIALTLLILISVFIYKDRLENIGLSFLETPLWTLALLACVLISYYLMNQIQIPPEKAEALKNQYKEVRYLLPTTPAHYSWSVALSVVAGVCEEIIFRGFLCWRLQEYMPLIAAVVLTNLVFGLCHYGTGFKNLFQAFLLGIFWSFLYYVTHSLWLPILMHITIDFYAAQQSYKLFGEKP